jgi:acyl-CoA dehydrogenase family protein 9
MREQQSFVKGLFFGAVEENLLFPWPEAAAGEVDRVHRLLEPLRRYFELRVDSVEIDRAGRIPVEVLRGLKELGCFGMAVPSPFGGMGLTSTGHARVMQEVTALDASVATTLLAHQSVGLKGLLLFGTEEQRHRYLPRGATGEIVAAFALSESGSGSDAASIQTRAELRPDGSYLLNGSKTSVTNGSFANVFTVFARTSVAEDGVKPRITAFVVERGPGVRSGPPTDKLGVRGSATTEVSFENVVVPAGNMLGEPGRGFKVAMQVLDSSRLDLAAGCVGVCKRVLKLSVERCRRRRAFNRSIGEFGLIKDKVALMMAETWALESMTYLTTGMADTGGHDLAVESAICKVFASETCWRVVNEALEIAAGAGYMGDQPYERILRDARFPMVFGSTNETLRAFIALAGMNGPGQEITEVARAMREPIKGFGLLSDFAIRKARGLVAGRVRLSLPHAALVRESLLLQDYTQALAACAEKIMRKHGRDIAEMQYTQKRTADMAIDLYALAACLARTTWTIERRGEEGARREIDLTAVFASACERRLSHIVAAVDRNDDELRKAVATKTYVDGGYPFDVI